MAVGSGGGGTGAGGSFGNIPPPPHALSNATNEKAENACGRSRRAPAIRCIPPRRKDRKNFNIDMTTPVRLREEGWVNAM
jgi:hypothetical protein